MSDVEALRAEWAAAVARRDAAAADDRDPAMARVSGALLGKLGRDTDRALARYTAADRNVQALQSKVARAEYDQREAKRVRLTRDDIGGAALVRTRHGWYGVVRVNAKTVTVATGYSWTDRIDFNDVLEVAS